MKLLFLGIVAMMILAEFVGVIRLCFFVLLSIVRVAFIYG